MIDARSYDLGFVNLIVDWKDIQPTPNTINLQSLQAFINAVKNEGMACVLRIYLNGGLSRQSSPDWLLDKVSSYYEGSYEQPIPWDEVYLDELHRFIDTLDNQIFPDALQMSVGGVYGEQVILNQEGTAPWPNGDYISTLFSCEERHVDLFSDHFQRVEKILMVNALRPSDISLNDRVLRYSVNNTSIRWIQTNMGVANLQERADGPMNLAMLVRFSETTSAFLEDESGFLESISQRLLQIKDIESQVPPFRFRSVTLNKKDLNEANREAIRLMKEHLNK